MPTRPRCSGSPTPDSCRICGDPMAPADRMTSAVAVACWVVPSRENATPVARCPSNSTRCTRALVTISRFGRFFAGFRYDLAVFPSHLTPRLDGRLAQFRLVSGWRGEQRTALAVDVVGLAFPVLGLF